MSETKLTFDFVTERRWHWTHDLPIESEALNVLIVAVDVGNQEGALLEVELQLQSRIREHLAFPAEQRGHVAGRRAAHSLAGFDDQNNAASLAHCIHELRVVQEAGIRD